MNETFNQQFLDWSRSEIDTIIDSLDDRYKEKVSEFYNMIFCTNLVQSQLTQLARQYAGNKSQDIIEMVNRLRTNLVVQPEANNRVRNLNQLHSGEPITLPIYFVLLKAQMENYYKMALEHRKKEDDLNQRVQRAEQQTKLQTANVASVVSRLKEVERENTEKDEAYKKIQDENAMNKQFADKFHKQEEVISNLNLELVKKTAVNEALMQPIMLREKLDNSVTKCNSLNIKIDGLDVQQTILLQEKESLTKRIAALSRNAEEIRRIEIEIKREEALLKQKKSDLDKLSRNADEICNQDEIDQYMRQQSQLLAEKVIISNKLKEYNNAFSRLNADQINLKKLQEELYRIERTLNDVIQDKSEKEEALRILKSEIENLKQKLEPYNQEGRSLSSAVSGSSVSSRSGMHSGLSSSGFHSPSSSRASTSSRPLPSPPLKAAAKAPVTTIGSARETLSMEELVKRPVEELKQMHESKKLNIHACDVSGRNLLHHACKSTSFNKLAVVQWLLQNNVNTECVDNSKKKPIDYAKGYGFDDIVRALDTKMPKANNSNNQSSSIQAVLSSSSCSSSFYPSSGAADYTNQVLPTMTPDQQNRFAAEQNHFIESKRKLEEYIRSSGDRVVSQMNHLRSTNGLASYDSNGRASPTSASVGLANSADGLANIRQCLEDCTESSETIEAFYAARYIELVLSRSMSSASPLSSVLAPKTVTNLYSTIGKLDESLRAKLTSRYTLVPLHINANHWVTLLISKQGFTYQINYIDPKSDEIPNNLIKHLRSILGERLRVNSIKANLQSEFDGINCGLYTIEICKALQPLFGSQAFSSDNIKQKLAALKPDIVETRINHLKIVNQIFDEQCVELGLSRPAFH